MNLLLVTAELPVSHDLAINPWLGLLLGLLLVVLNGFFVAAEFALVKIRPTQIEPLLASGLRRAQILQHMIGHLDAYLSACQLGITLASLGLGWIGEPAFAWLLEPLVMRLPGASPALLHSLSLTMAFALITVLHIVLGELAPKSLAIRQAKATSLWVAWPLRLFYQVTYPAIWLLNRAAIALLQPFGVVPATESALGHSEEELRLLLSMSAGKLSSHKRELLDNVFQLYDRVARQIMVPRGDVVYLSVTQPVGENLRRARQSGHTRFPLCRGELDEVVGLVHIKDIFRSEVPPERLEDIAREIEFVPETLTLDRLLKRLLAEQAHLVAVLDEYGGVSGIVTLDNVMEELVGQIHDEFDKEKPQLVELAPGVHRVAGSLLVDELGEALGVEISDRDEDTVAGVVLSELGRRPVVGDRVTVGDLELEVTEADLNRIKTLKVRHLAPQRELPPPP